MSEPAARPEVLTYARPRRRRGIRLRYVAIVLLCAIAGGVFGDQYLHARHYYQWLSVFQVDSAVSTLTPKQHASAILSSPVIDRAISQLLLQGVHVDAKWLGKHVEIQASFDGDLYIRCRDTWFVDGMDIVRALEANYAGTPGTTVRVPTTMMPRKIVLDLYSVPLSTACGGALGVIVCLIAAKRSAGRGA